MIKVVPKKVTSRHLERVAQDALSEFEATVGNLEVVGQGQPCEYVKANFEDVKKPFGDALGNWSFDQYMAFLIGRSLVTVDKGTYHITNLGVEYLTWMTRNGRSENRPL